LRIRNWSFVSDYVSWQSHGHGSAIDGFTYYCSARDGLSATSVFIAFTALRA
jgi:hypothetical protein